MAPSLLAFLQVRGDNKWPWLTIGCFLFSVENCVAEDSSK